MQIRGKNDFGLLSALTAFKEHRGTSIEVLEEDHVTVTLSALYFRAAPCARRDRHHDSQNACTGMEHPRNI